jgi:protein O-mannosyl-transferase
MTDSGSRGQQWVVCLLLVVAILAVYAQAPHCFFVYLDDPDYVTSNPDIQHGLNWHSLKWAFTTGHGANWHPLTWVSHMIDCQLYGLKPAGHHLTSLLLHVANSALLFLILNRMTGAMWRSAWVAAVFALHPLRVESVIWVAERKDVLSTFFWMLTVGAYLRFTEEFKVQSSQSKVFYGLSLFFFALGLMSKSMLVTLPFVLLLLDYWPLGRLEFGPHFSWRLVVEKIPFLLLAAAASIVTFVLQKTSGVVASFSAVPLGQRLANTPVAYVRYLMKIFWPSGLSVFYGFEQWKFYQVAGSVLILASITVWVMLQGRARPYLAVGWFWFLGMLVPTIGLVQVGHQSMADRYSYVPSVGISLMVAWGLCDWAARRPHSLQVVGTLGALAVAACALLTPRQIVFWKSADALFGRAAEISDQDAVTCYNVGVAVLEQGNYARAVRCFERSLKAADNSTPKTFLARVQNNLGCALLEQGQVPSAISNFESALISQPNYPQVYYNMGRAFLTNRQPDVAVDCFQHALALDPNVAEIHYKLANALVQLGRPAAAITEYSKTLQLRPDNDEAANNLAWLLATCSDRSLRDGAKALTLARQASEHSHDQNPRILGTLAAAYAETGQRADALAIVQHALQLALAQDNPALARTLESQIRQYKETGGSSFP